MPFQALFIPLCEGWAKFNRGVALRGVERLVGERKTAKEPQKAFGRGLFLLGFLVLNEKLEGGGLSGVGEISGADFLEGVEGAM